MKKKDWLIVIVVACVTFLIIFVSGTINSTHKKKEEKKVIKATSSFTIKFIKEANKYSNNSNYIVSPYSVEMALSMLRVGADGNTLKELDTVLRARNFNLNNDKVKIANALFIKDFYKNVIEKDFVDTLKLDYDSEVLIDKFDTPDVINNWVNEKTDKMIPKLLDEMSDDFALGIANAISIDTKWQSQFECEDTYGADFTYDKNKTKVEMMHKEYSKGAMYLDGDVKGIMLPYKDDLEFIGLLPKKDVSTYINNLTDKDFNEQINSFKSLEENDKLYLSLPRFSYEYDFSDFGKSLMDLGIKDAFNPDSADFSKIITKENLLSLGKDNLYVDSAIHKAKIELNEEGTKAAAVTYFGLSANAAIMEDDYNKIYINFDRPFLYLIRDKSSHEILFFGVVYKPNKWNGSTCKEG